MIKHYQIVSCLGQGGFGKVFEAWDSKLQRSVAIKCLNVDGLLSPATDLLREARMAASLNHPAFVKIHALEDYDNSQAIVMELIKGETLKQVIAHQPGVAKAINVIHQIAEAMQQAHELGLTHGDLKPSNIMLEPSGAIRILDFGLASKADAQATTSMLQQDPQGTIAYMAPERLLGAPLTPLIDVYALGVIFYELLNGQRPFADLSGLALAAALVQSSSDQWDYSQELSPSLIRLIRRMTAKQAVQRLSSMADVLDQLDAFNNGTFLENNSVQSEIHIPPKANNESPKQQRNKHFKNAVFLSLVVIGCVVFGGWLTRNVLWRFEEVIPRYSESQEMKLGMDALEQWDRPGSLDAAIKHFNNLAEQNPENAAAIAGLSIAYSLKYAGDRSDEYWLRKAKAAAQQVKVINSDLPISLVAEGYILHESGSIEAALKCYERAMKMDPHNQFGWYGKIEILRSLNRYDEAINLAKDGIQKYPQSRTFYDLIGDTYLKLGRYEDAEVASRKSINIQPDSVYAYANLSFALQYQGKTDDAIHVLQQGLYIRSSAWLLNNLASIYFFRGDYVDAVSTFEMALNPSLGNYNDYLAWANLADTQLWVPGKRKDANKNYEKAISLLKPILQRNPSSLQLNSRLALYNARVGNIDNSKKLLSAFSIESSVEPDFNFRVGLAYELIGERSLALEYIHHAHSLGYSREMIGMEPSLELLRGDPDYKIR